MVKRRVGAIATYKAQRRAIQKARITAAPVVKPGAFTVRRMLDGSYQVWSPAGMGLHGIIPAQCRAGGFETREAAQAWIDDED